jgi:hypothetical protein
MSANLKQFNDKEAEKVKTREELIQIIKEHFGSEKQINEILFLIE